MTNTHNYSTGVSVSKQRDGSIQVVEYSNQGEQRRVVDGNEIFGLSLTAHIKDE